MGLGSYTEAEFIRAPVVQIKHTSNTEWLRAARIRGITGICCLGTRRYLHSMEGPQGSENQHPLKQVNTTAVLLWTRKSNKCQKTQKLHYLTTASKRKHQAGRSCTCLVVRNTAIFDANLKGSNIHSRAGDSAADNTRGCHVLFGKNS